MNEFVAKRLKGYGLPLPRVLLTVTQLLSEWKSSPPLCYAGWPPIQIDLSESGLADYIAWLEQAWELGINKPFILSSHDNYHPQVFLTIEKCNTFESIKFLLPSKYSQKVFRLDSFINLVTQICISFCAYQGYVYNDKLSGLYTRAIRLFKNPSLIEGALDTFPRLLLESEFNSRHVPNGVWWINFWDRVQVETIGVNQIKNAPWEKIIELSGGSMVLVATAQLTNIRNPLHLEKLRNIITYLRLDEIQKKFSIVES